MCMTTIDDCLLINLPRHRSDRCGNLTVADNLPFSIKRVYYLYDVPGGENRGEHAHRTLNQLIVAASGSFTVMLDDGNNRREVFLNRPYVGLLIPAGIWHHLHDFSSGAVALALTSDLYDEADYLRNYGDFKNFRSEHYGAD
ncbi:MAG: FdtA/QdtA family cupin domain-containing protein [Muribaculaceae bacterium]|nr:FdtA/QdtA family cupin domain-containing protein [Muribaculaceae bacterium]